ncbi:unnamed protein product, partial [Prorocentrum cordatum]
APSWMKQLIDGIRTSNYRIEVMEQNFAQEVQVLQSSISNTDKNVQMLNLKLQTLEASTSATIQEAVAAAVDTKLKRIDETLCELQSSPTPRSEPSARRALAAGPRPDGKHAAMERAHRVIVVGFPRKMMQASLRRAADLILASGVPQSSPRPTVRTYDMTKKITLDFTDSTKATDFLNMLQAGAPVQFPDPIYPQQMITLRAKRDMAPGTRLLFLAMGKARGALKVDMVSDHIPIVVTISTFRPQDDESLWPELLSFVPKLPE